MKSSQNSVSTVLFSTQEGKRNGNDPKAPMNPDAPDKRRSGFCILMEGRERIGMPGSILCWEAKRRGYCGHWQMGHNMLYFPDLIFHSRDCIISVQSRKNGKHSGWNICGGTIRSDLHITMRETPNGDPLCGMLYCIVRGQTSAWKRGRPSVRWVKKVADRLISYTRYNLSI